MGFLDFIKGELLEIPDEPILALCEARRLVKQGGRLLMLASVSDAGAGSLETRFANWCQAAGLRLAPPRQIPRLEPRWLLAVATPADADSAAA